ncbi:23S rRNA pseudouridine2604 synthase, partial [Anaerocolumna jejuensis DSM 15929]
MAKRTKKLLQIDETTAGGDGVRLNRYLSDSGACSRREADRLIEEGHVTVDGVRAGLGMKITDGQTVLLDGMPVKREEKLVFIALNKPKGIVCTTDKREKDNIIDFLKFDKRIYPVGRLDKDSEGLILLTNDGSIVNKILRAGNYHEKEYVVTVDKPLTAEFLNGMEAGVPILDTVTRPCKIKALDKYTFQIILTQGLNRQIRRMCEYFDYKVLTLKRIRIMNIPLGHLQTGGYRNVTDKEIAGLTEAIKDSVNEAVVDVKYIESMPARKDNKGKQGISYRNEPGNGRVKSVKLKEKNRELVAKESKYKKASSVGRQKSTSRQEFVDKQESTDKLKFEDRQKSANERKFADKQKSTNASKFADKRKSSNGQKFADKQRIANDQKFTDKQKSADEKKFADKQKSASGQKFSV